MQAGIKIAGRNINNLRHADDTTLMAESEEELKSLLMKVKVESEKVGLKLNIHFLISSENLHTNWTILLVPLRTHDMPLNIREGTETSVGLDWD